MTEQPSHGCQVATGSGEMEWGGAVTVSQIWVDSLVFHLELKSSVYLNVEQEKAG